MISHTDLRKIATARLRDAEVLLQSARHYGSVYLCGYSVEIALKARICRTLKWAGFPASNKEFDGYHSFKTHNLDVLLRLSGVEAKIKTKLLAEWSAVAMWEPEVRYRAIGTATAQEVADMVMSAKAIMVAL